MNAEIERMVTALADRVRNLEIWKAEQILLARDGELPSPNPLPGAGPEIASMVKAINENPLNAMCDREEKALNDAAFRAGNSMGKTHTHAEQVRDYLHPKIPVGWVSAPGPMATKYPHRDEDILHQAISPDPSIPWNPKYVAILPEQVQDNDEYWSGKHWYPVVHAKRLLRPHASFAWRRMVQPISPDNVLSSSINEGQTESLLKESDVLWNPSKTWKGMFSAPVEPAPGSDQDHPPLGYRRAPVGGWMEKGYLFWNGTGTWQHGGTLFGTRISETEFPIANPIPANEGDSQKEVAELRATVERLEAELETTKRLLAESLVERNRLKNLHDARKVRIEGFRDVLRERLGDLV